MSVPEFKKFFLPTLEFFKDNEIHTKKQIAELNKNHFNLDDSDILETTSNGHELKYKDRTNWAITYLFNAGLLNRESRGKYYISDSGRELLSRNLESIDENILLEYESFQEFKNKAIRNEDGMDLSYNVSEILSPKERMDVAYSEINEDLSSRLLNEILNNSPDFFEELVVDLLINMGYGGSKKEAGKVIGKVGDNGVDGVIKEDQLGLDQIYIQAKRYTDTKIGSEVMNSFIGALDLKNSNKGVFITTSDFTNGAKEAASTSNKHIALINGEKLTKLLIKFNVGVSTKEIYKIKEIDIDYFDS